MFGLGSGELMIVITLAILLIAPKDLPNLARQLGKWYRSFKLAVNEVKSSFEDEINRPEDPPKNKFLDK